MLYFPTCEEGGGINGSEGRGRGRGTHPAAPAQADSPAADVVAACRQSFLEAEPGGPIEGMYRSLTGGVWAAGSPCQLCIHCGSVQSETPAPPLRAMSSGCRSPGWPTAAASVKYLFPNPLSLPPSISPSTLTAHLLVVAAALVVSCPEQQVVQHKPNPLVVVRAHLRRDAL